MPSARGGGRSDRAAVALEGVGEAVQVQVSRGRLHPCIEAFFERRRWTPWDFQREAWAEYASGRSGLIHVPTGAGKTYAAFMGPLSELAGEVHAPLSAGPAALRVLYITPLRAVARDIDAALRKPVEEAGLPIRVETRTGDTGSSVRARQRESLPHVLVTTPESLSLMLTWPEPRRRFDGLRCVIIDEWHELLASKRGTQTQLALARLRGFAPELRAWAMSATLANLDEAAAGVVPTGANDRGEGAVIVSGDMPRPVEIDTLLPESLDGFPWAGHLGLAMLPRLVEWIDPERSTLVFVNTRSQCERWFHAMLAVRPEWEPIAAIHHGSIDRAARERVEGGLKDGSIRLVVATSSLDLGVDFSPVERVVQVGSPKGVARMLQRAGRSGHRPGETARILCVPAHALEIVEVGAVRSAIAEGRVEARTPERKPIDVLAQHMVTCAIGGGFVPDELFDEVRSAPMYADLTRGEFDWALSLVREGGGTLRAYPEYRKVEADQNGRMVVAVPRVAQLHRLNVGTITGEATVDIAFANGRRIGSIEENFVSGLRHGQRFFFAGRTLEFVHMRDMAAIVRPARGKTNLTPIWGGTRLPISESMSEAMRDMLERAGRIAGGGEVLPDDPPELVAAMPVLGTQARISRLPTAGELLIELCETREGAHAFVFPFEGRLVHAGLAGVLALRLARARKASITIAANDYGFELLTEKGFPFENLLTPAMFDPEQAIGDSVDALNLGEMAKRQFREVARVAGLVFQSYPGARKAARQVQATASLLYDVFREFDPDNPLMHQARREVLERQFEEGRLGRTMARLHAVPHAVVRVARPTPLSLPLLIEREAGRLSTRSLLERVEQITRSWGEGPGKADGATPATATSAAGARPRRPRRRS
ncbi:MAG: ligase-associated DNA damage response DEXH box helicase [Phycisphaerales bacterium]|nr:ligase-associated DNA damage response DEXH box helicase [Phycisphaerales bacterium]